MATNSYWENRKAVEDKYIAENLAQDKVADNVLAGYYNKLNKNLEQSILAEYTKIANATGADVSKLASAVSAGTLKDFDTELAAIRAKAKDLGSTEALARLDLAAAQARISRLQYIQASAASQAIDYGIDVQNYLAGKLNEGVIKEFQRQAGLLGMEYIAPSSKRVAQLVNMYPEGMNDLSTTLWKNNDSFRASLASGLYQQLYNNAGPAVFARSLRQYLKNPGFNVKYVTERLARTEMARVQTAATLTAAKDNGFEYVKWAAEPTACKICSAIAADESIEGTDNGVYSLEDVPYLPAHANCRCSVIPWYDPRALEAPINAKSATRLEFSDDIKNEVGEENYKALVDRINAPDFDPTIKALFTKYKDNLKIVYKENTGTAFYSPANNEVHLGKSAFEGRKLTFGNKERLDEPLQTVFHEMGHWVDKQILSDLAKTRDKAEMVTKVRIPKGYVGAGTKMPAIQVSSWKDFDLGKVLTEDEKALNINPETGKSGAFSIFRDDTPYKKMEADFRDSQYNNNDYSVYQKYSATSDILEAAGFGDSPLGSGHGGKKYWQPFGYKLRNAGYRDKELTEFVAHYFETTAVDTPSAAPFKESFPKAVEYLSAQLKKFAEKGEF